MTTHSTLYPALDRYFENRTELAHAANRSRKYLWLCLTGQREFTRADKKAIAANIMARIVNQRGFSCQELEDANTAWKGKFDEIYRRKDR